MLEDFGPALLCTDLDLDSFEGPREWAAQFRRRDGWLVIADCTIQSAHDLQTTRLIAACDGRGTPIPAFRARHLTECHWLNPTPCDEWPPDTLDDLICEEQGALLARWHRENNAGLAEAFEAGEMRVAELEGRTRALINRNERHIAELRQRRRHPAATPEMRAQLAQIIAELEEENEALVAEMTEARAAIRAAAAEAEEALWAREDLLVEIESVQVIRWRASGTARDGLPARSKQYATGFMPASGRTGLEEPTAEEVLAQLDAALARAAEREARRNAAEDPIVPKRERSVPAPTLAPTLPKYSPALRRLREGQVVQTSAPVAPLLHVSAVTQALVNATPSPVPNTAPTAAAAETCVSHWTPERVALLTRMWTEGHSAATIGQALDGVSRNAVIGKAQRLRLPRKSPPTVEEAAPRSTPAARECQEPEQPGSPVQSALAALAQARQRYWGKEG